ncbi:MULTISPECIES: gliding motility lipoprotein GldB [Tenacibaculum]|uniref:gliding motility lipoprotein GldB n=1 Tax=Tenacibaculum TaxID=104267 RepID=UPI0008986B02|nr:gliding motility lipoprotein GldB [Tenacibaculum sp. MAR_2010_89]SEE24233.1 gliding motility-associated lipoprotein GldB [Tenacibaculum sp. MAR_2010_89]
MQKFLALFLITVLFFSCKNGSKDEVDVSNISINFKLDRFDVDFYNSHEKQLNELKQYYPFLFPFGVHDSVWLKKRKDKDEQELFVEVQKKYNNIDVLKNELALLFKYVKYYNTKFKSPKVVTMLTNIDYDHRVVYADSLMLISLDSYLGEKHEFYGEYPAYIKQNNTKDRIIIDVANSIINKQVLIGKGRTFVDKMVDKGKKMYLLDAYVPMIDDRIKIGYNALKYSWAKNNEEEIWQYFIEKDLLFSTDKSLDRRFLEIAPFSKFYKEEDNLSPGRIGEWIGWQIVRSYMDKNDVSLHQLIRTSEEEIFKKSKYKPRR